MRALPRVERLLYMCDAARAKERQGEPGDQFHAHCRGRARNDSPALERVPDADGRFRAGRHFCVCPCHAPGLPADARRERVSALMPVSGRHR
jgi:hypothetical protein